MIREAMGHSGPQQEAGKTGLEPREEKLWNGTRAVFKQEEDLWEREYLVCFLPHSAELE